jgi:hypothetical protein
MGMSDDATKRSGQHPKHHQKDAGEGEPPQHDQAEQGGRLHEGGHQRILVIEKPGVIGRKHAAMEGIEYLHRANQGDDQACRRDR